MKLYMFAVFDSAVQGFGRPIFGQSVGQVVRSFSDEVNRNAPDNPYFKHPEDYELRLLGQFDDETGRVEGVMQECVARGKDVFQLSQ